MEDVWQEAPSRRVYTDVKDKCVECGPESVLERRGRVSHKVARPTSTELQARRNVEIKAKVRRKVKATPQSRTRTVEALPKIKKELSRGRNTVGIP